MEPAPWAEASERLGVVTGGCTDTTERIGKIRSTAELFSWSKRESEETEVGESAPCLDWLVCGCVVLRVDRVEFDDSVSRWSGNVFRCFMCELRCLGSGDFGGSGDPEDMLQRALGYSVRQRPPLLSHPIGSRLVGCDGLG